MLALAVASALIELSSAISASGPIQHSWQFLGGTRDAAQFVDDSTIVTDGDTRRAWVISIPNPNGDLAKDSPGIYSMSANSINCRLRTQSIAKMNLYNPDDELVAEKSDVYPTQPIAPGSSGEVTAAYLCEGQIHTDKVVKLTNIRDVKSVGSNWQDIMDKLEAMIKPK